MTHIYPKYEESINEFYKVISKDADEILTEPISGSDKNLAVRAAVFNKDAKNLIVSVSGVHGPEFEIGHKINMMLRETFVQRLNKYTGLLIIDMLNPYGTRYDQRTNENNVDINRSFIKEANPELESRIKKLNEGFETIKDLVTPACPRADDAAEHNKFIEEVKKKIQEYGFPKFANLIAAGQFNHPESIFYGHSPDGMLEESVKIYDKIQEKFINGRERVFMFDWHTGVGDRYKAHETTTHERGSTEYGILNNIIPDLNSISQENASNEDKYHKAIGTLMEYAETHAKVDNFSGLIVDFGTVGDIGVLSALVALNQIRNYPKTTSDEVKENVYKRVAAAFRPSEEGWTNAALGIAEKRIHNICEAFGFYGTNTQYMLIRR